MSLTTPVTASDFNNIFPGENWFLYWKTSASLWKSKLSELSNVEKVFIPINWSFHSETGSGTDFAGKKPETDLAKLYRLLTELEIEPIFLLPLSPVPYLANGGVPSLLARTMSLDKNKLAYSFMDADQNVHKLGSFFDERVYKSFRNFVNDLANYFSTSGISAAIYGIEAGHVKNFEFSSYFDDYSSCMENGLGRYLKSVNEEELSNQKITEKRSEFTQTMKDLYLETAREFLASNWEGVRKISFLGANSKIFMDRIVDHDFASDYSKELFDSISNNTIPSSVLVPTRLKRANFGKQLKNIVVNSVEKDFFTHADFYDDFQQNFSPFFFFKIYKNSLGGEAIDNWEKCHLWSFLVEKYKGLYRILSPDDFEIGEDEVCEKIAFLSGDAIDQDKFQNILKVFMNGGRVILNRTGISLNILRKFEAFFLENSLNVEKVNFHTTIHHISLGEGRLLIFDGETLRDMETEKHFEFWQRVISTFDIDHVDSVIEEGIDHFWKRRESTHSELDYEEIRRIELYNSTSYKKQVSLRLGSHFALLKVLDEYNVNVQKKNNDLIVDLLPEGSVFIDIGKFA